MFPCQSHRGFDYKRIIRLEKQMEKELDRMEATMNRLERKEERRTFYGVLEDFTARELVPGTGDYDIVV
jgi:hypothetical protein